MSDSLQPHGLCSPWNSPDQNTRVSILSLLQGLKPRSPALQADSLPAEPQGKPKNTGVSSLSLLQWIFLTQELSGSPALQGNSLPSESPGKPKNTGVSSLSLLQWIFLNQELNRGPCMYQCPAVTAAFLLPPVNLDKRNLTRELRERISYSRGSHPVSSLQPDDLMTLGMTHSLFGPSLPYI